MPPGRYCPPVSGTLLDGKQGHKRTEGWRMSIEEFPYPSSVPLLGAGHPAFILVLILTLTLRVNGEPSPSPVKFCTTFTRICGTYPRIFRQYFTSLSLARPPPRVPHEQREGPRQNYVPKTANSVEGSPSRFGRRNETGGPKRKYEKCVYSN